MARSLAMEYGPRGIRANCVAPGVVETGLWNEHLARPEVADAVVSLIPTRRTSTPEEVADVIVFLASDAGDYVTGQTWVMDGGLTMHWGGA